MFRFIKIDQRLINLDHITTISYREKDDGNYFFTFTDFQNEKHYFDVGAHEIENLLYQLTKS